MATTKETESRSMDACPVCGREDVSLRDGRCLDCWYGSDDRPKPVRDRYAKLEELREAGIEPFAYSFDRSHTLTSARDLFPDPEDDEGDGGEDGPAVRVAGRIRSLRDLGGSMFAHLEDRDGRLQVYLKRNVLDETENRLMDLLDLGDWVGVQGPLFRTRTGEITVRAERLELLSKTLRPLPYGKEEVTDEGERVVHSGFTDVESRYRQRYADLAVNPDVRELFLTRSRIVSSLRRVLDGRGFVEVETPILQPMYGGAFARPFVTHHRSLDRRMYLRIADELYLKRLIVGNLDRVYEIGKDFRNEGIDRKHNPEFTMLELYQAFADYEDMMDMAEVLVAVAAQEAVDGATTEFEGRTVDFSRPWDRVGYSEALRDATGIELETAEREELVAAARELGREDAGELDRARLLDALFSLAVEPELVDPTIVRDYPLEVSPLAKPARGDARLAERFEVVAGGQEIVNAFSELNDPLDQYRRFERQARRRAAGDEEAEGLDEDYVRALEYGLPPTGGLGLGVDRLVMLLTGQDSIREVVLYPILRDDEGRG